MKIAANPVDDERGREIGEVEIARKIFDFDGDTSWNGESGVVAQRHFGDACVDVDSRRGARIDLDRGTIGAGDFEISSSAQDAD